MRDTTDFAGGEILIAVIQGAELVAFQHDSRRTQTKSILIEAARPAVDRPGRKAISSSRQMQPPSAATGGRAIRSNRHHRNIHAVVA